MRLRIPLAVLALAAFAAGCSDQSNPTMPNDASGIVAGESSASSNGGAAVAQEGEIVAPLPPGVWVITSGPFTLTRNAKGLTLTGNSNELVDGDAYTIWAAIFDNPNGCVGGPGRCAGSDFGVRQAQATLSNFGGFVANGNDIEIHLSRHDASRQTLADGLGRSGIDNPLRAEVHLIFRSHGLAEIDSGDLAAQTSQVAAFCNLPAVGCEDQAAVLFFPPGPPGKG